MFQILKEVPFQAEVTQEYIEGFVRANKTILYQLVYDPIDCTIKPLNTYPEDLDVHDLNFAGPYPLLV